MKSKKTHCVERQRGGKSKEMKKKQVHEQIDVGLIRPTSVRFGETCTHLTNNYVGHLKLSIKPIILSNKPEFASNVAKLR